MSQRVPRTDRHTPRLGRLRSSSFIDHCDSTVDLSPSQHRRLANIALAGTQDPHIVCKRPQLIQHGLRDNAPVGGRQSIQNGQASRPREVAERRGIEDQRRHGSGSNSRWYASIGRATSSGRSSLVMDPQSRSMVRLAPSLPARYPPSTARA